MKNINLIIQTIIVSDKQADLFSELNESVERTKELLPPTITVTLEATVWSGEGNVSLKMSEISKSLDKDYTHHLFARSCDLFVPESFSKDLMRLQVIDGDVLYLKESGFSGDTQNTPLYRNRAVSPRWATRKFGAFTLARGTSEVSYVRSIVRHVPTIKGESVSYLHRLTEDCPSPTQEQKK